MHEMGDGDVAGRKRGISVLTGHAEDQTAEYYWTKWNDHGREVDGQE